MSAPATLFTNGKIFLSGVPPGTNAGLHRDPTFASCMLIRDSLIEHVGSETDAPIASALSQSSPTTTTVINLHGKTILPGFIDGHMHLMLLGQSLSKLDLSACTSLASIRATIAAYAAAHPHLPRILARGFMHSMAPEGVCAADLDGLDIPGREHERPVLVDAKDLHSTWCNTAGIRDLGAEHWPDLPGGGVERDAEGRMTGVFSEAANITFVWPHVASVVGLAERMKAVRAAVDAYHAAGYTGMVEMAMDEGAWEALLALKGEGGVKMRIAAYWLVKPCEKVEDMLVQVDRAAELAREFNAATSPDCRVVGIKVICDGVVDACTAGLSEPYAHNGHVEVPRWTPEQLGPVVKRADTSGLQVALHAIGDATVKMVVEVLSTHASADRRPRIEHMEVTKEEDVRRMGERRITASIQPVHADPAILKAWPRLLGEHRCGRAFAYRQFADLGAPLALGSDSPTAPHAPLDNIYVGTTRRSARKPEMETTVNPHWALGLCEAVAAATEGTAYSVFDEHRLGVLKKGYKADFVVVDMEWEKERLRQAKVTETWFDGVKVWSP